MAVVQEQPWEVYRGSEPTFTFDVAITNGGDNRVFYMRFGRKGASAQLEKTMSESNSTATSVRVTTSLSASETAALKETLVDYQVVCSSPYDVVAEGKLEMLPMIKP